MLQDEIWAVIITLENIEALIISYKMILIYILLLLLMNG